MRMHGLALRMLMTKEEKQVCGWLGYKRHVKYTKKGGQDKINTEEENFFDLSE
jgi:hypothetical protein